jgi:hypothetical protein
MFASDEPNSLGHVESGNYLGAIRFCVRCGRLMAWRESVLSEWKPTLAGERRCELTPGDAPLPGSHPWRRDSREGGRGVLASGTGERSEALKGVEESRLDDRHSLTSVATDRSLGRGDDSDRFIAGPCVRQIGSHDTPVSLGLPESVTARSRRSKPSNGS